MKRLRTKLALRIAPWLTPDQPMLPEDALQALGNALSAQMGAQVRKRLLSNGKLARY